MLFRNPWSQRRSRQASRAIESLESRTLLAAFGALVPAYGTEGGGTTVDFPNALNGAIELLTDPYARTIAITEATVLRYDQTGRLDPKFGKGGKLDLGFDRRAIDGALDREGNLYILSNASTSLSSSRAILRRYTPRGVLDTSWANGGVANVTASERLHGGHIAVQRDGKVVVAGNIGDSSPFESRTFVARLTTSGALDNNFASDGRVDLTLSSVNNNQTRPTDAVLDVAVVQGNRIVLIGRGRAIDPLGLDGDPQFVAVKFSPIGLFDDTFSDGSGFLRRDDGVGTAGLIQPDGSFAIGGKDTEERPLVSYFEADGSRRWQATTARQNRLRVTEMVMLRDGRIVVAGEDNSESQDGQLGLATVSADGVFGSAVNPTLPRELPTGSVQLATWGSALFAIDTDARDIDSQDPRLHIMMKVDTGSPGAHPDQFGSASSSDMDKTFDGGIDLAYYDRIARRLMYAHRDGNGFWSAPEIIDSHARAGEQLDLVSSDTPGQPWIAYYDGSSGDLKTAHRTANGKWQLTAVDTRGNTGQRPSLMLSSDRPQISYYDASKQDLRFASLGADGKWSLETIEASGDAGKWSAIDRGFVNNKNVVRVAYSDSLGNVNYAQQRSTGGWDKARVATVPGAAGGAAFVDLHSTNGNPVITYNDTNNGDLMLAYRSGSKWLTRTVASAGVEGQHARFITRNPDSTLYILSYNRSADRLTSFALSTSDLGGAVKRTVVASGFGQLAGGASQFSYDSQSIASASFVGIDSGLGTLRVIDGRLN